ncbi:MAG: cytochrome c3 family protein [Phycisphaerales bacterium]
MSTVFPKWTNRLPTMMLVGVLGGLVTVIGVVWYYFTPKFWRVGYMPTQPASGFSHQIHAGKLGMDCRYCHSNVEISAEANIPSVSTCMGCHAEGRVNDQLYAKAARVQFVRDAWEANESIPWRRVHKVPDYVRNFPHNIHVNAGVSCFSCHGNIMEQAVVHHAEPMSMGWCLECHRDPTPHLVPKDQVTNLAWVRNQISKLNDKGVPVGGFTGNMPSAGDPKDPLSPGTPGGVSLLKALQEKEGDLHNLPSNCGACHY